MLSDKEVKARFRLEAQKEPEKNYPVRVLKEKGFSRGKCKKCGKFFWNLDPEREVCGDSNCAGGYTFIGQSPAKNKLDYLEAWAAYKKFFEDLGYLSVERKPVVARWRDDVYWVGASVYGFQPYVVSGEIKPPSNAVIIPQLSLRFNDIDNVGITGSHYVCFDMFGQLHFEPKQKYDPELYLQEYFDWITKPKGMGIPEKELTLHEDAWAGGGTFGSCMEFFSMGCEIGNQVYMQYANKETGREELSIKVLDMGQGHERVPWFTMGKSTSYETTFPTVVKKLNELTGIKVDHDLMQKFLPYSAYLNVDEVEDIEKTWGFVAKKMEMNVNELKKKILPLAALYSVAEHSRAALVALNDGALPSNVGGGYNLRTIIRRALDFIDRHGWKLDFAEVALWHADYLKPIYPELKENSEEVKEILENERKKHFANREKSKQIIARLKEGLTGKGNLKNQTKKGFGKAISEEKLIELYDSHGLSPELIKTEFEKEGLDVVVPEDFYAKVAERHSFKPTETATGKKEKIGFPELPETEALYSGNWKINEFKAKVLGVKDNFVALDKTLFYPTSGGQLHDIGTINGLDVVDIFKEGKLIVHKLEKAPDFREGETVSGEVDFERRKQLTQHHTGAHLVNVAARMILGQHIWQAGASKTPEKARLDITHFDQLSEEQLKRIEAKANELIGKNLSVKKEFLDRAEAEEKYGMRIYQGGFVPGKKLRIVSIADLDHEACGGTHVNSTKEVEGLKIINSTKIQDGVIRINFVCGKASESMSQGKGEVLREAAELLGVSVKVVPARAKELFEKWKKARKVLKGKKIEGIDLELNAEEEMNLSGEELLNETARILSTQPEHVAKTISRFLKELNQTKEKLRE